MMNKSKLVLAYSGGLDTSYSLQKLSQDGFEVHAVSINTGGFSQNFPKNKRQPENTILLGETAPSLCLSSILPQGSNKPTEPPYKKLQLIKIKHNSITLLY